MYLNISINLSDPLLPAYYVERLKETMARGLDSFLHTPDVVEDIYDHRGDYTGRISLEADEPDTEVEALRDQVNDLERRELEYLRADSKLSRRTG